MKRAGWLAMYHMSVAVNMTARTGRHDSCLVIGMLSVWCSMGKFA